jgi:hypothetical protein
MSDYEPTPKEIKGLIEAVFSEKRSHASALEGLERRQTEVGEAVRFTVASGEIGELHCFYLLEPLARALLIKHKGTENAFVHLSEILIMLETGLHIGLENIRDVANLNVQQLMEEVSSVAQKKSNAVLSKKHSARRKAMMKELTSRNLLLLDPLKTGPSAGLTFAKMSAAATSLLMSKRIEKRNITITHLASLLQCGESAIYKYFKKTDSSLGEFLDLIEDRIGQLTPLIVQNK